MQTTKTAVTNGLAPPQKQFDFIGNRRWFMLITGIVIGIGIIFNIINGTQLDIEFQGGTLIDYTYTGQIEEKQLSTLVENTLGKTASISLGEDLAGSKQTITVSFPAKEALTNEQQAKLTEEISKAYADNNITLAQSSTVNPTSGSGFFIKCIYAVVLGAVLVTLYVGLRFRRIGGISAGVFAMIALVHDLIIAYLVYVIFKIPLDDNFIAVELTLLGYSLNDTIVIYDRIRENERYYGRRMTIDEIVNKSLNQTYMRNINTALATFAAIVTVCIVAQIRGIDSILSFAFPMAIGIVAGCYSSILLSCPLWVVWRNHKEKVQAAKEDRRKLEARTKKRKK